MAVAVADVRNIGPEFRDAAAVPDPEIQTAINDAAGEVSSAAWGTAADLGTKWLAAHFIAVAHPELSQAQKVRIYETPGAEDAGALGATRFGREYVRLRDSQLHARLPVVSTNQT